MVTGRQIINGREYVYEYKSVWNKNKKRSEQKRQYIGRIINDEFVPNKTWRLREELEKAKSTSKKTPPTPVKQSKRLFTGATHLLDQIAKATGVAEDLRATFPKFHKEILSLAYYLALEPNSPMYRFSRWAKTHEHPLGKDLASQRSSELLSRITEENKTDFFARQSKRRAEVEYLFYDSTSISSWSEQLKQVKYGHNKDGDHLAQINLAMLFGQKSGLPAYYRKLPGNITDVMTLEHLLSDIKHLALKKVCLVMDRGFYSEKNIHALFEKSHQFILGAKISLKWVQEHLASVRSDFERMENYHADTELFMMTQRFDWDTVKPKNKNTTQKKSQVYLHTYYNNQLATDEKMRFYKMLNGLEEEIVSGRRKEAKEKLYEKYFEISDLPAQIKPKQSAIDKVQKNFGYFVLLSNDVSDAAEALRIYRSKDMIEKAFSDLKSRLNMRRTSVSSEENLEGKLFLQFVALIFLSYVKRIMDNHGLFKKYTMQEMFDELDVIEKYEQPKQPAFFSEITEKQKKLYAAFGFTHPA